jgi:hypothetical protein
VAANITGACGGSAESTTWNDIGENRLRRVDVIKKVKGGYKVLSEKGKNLGGPYKTKAEAEKRLKQVEYFKRRKG